jgi:ribosome recycling factor
MGKFDMDAAIEHLQNELKKIRSRKASPTMLDGIHGRLLWFFYAS